MWPLTLEYPTGQYRASTNQDWLQTELDPLVVHLNGLKKKSLWDIKYSTYAVVCLLEGFTINWPACYTFHKAMVNFRVNTHPLTTKNKEKHNTEGSR